MCVQCYNCLGQECTPFAPSLPNKSACDPAAYDACAITSVSSNGTTSIDKKKLVKKFFCSKTSMDNDTKCSLKSQWTVKHSGHLYVYNLGAANALISTVLTLYNQIF